MATRAQTRAINVAMLSVYCPIDQRSWGIPGITITLGRRYDTWMHPGNTYRITHHQGEWWMSGDGYTNCLVLHHGQTAHRLPSRAGNVALYDDSDYTFEPRKDGWELVRHISDDPQY